MKDKPSRLHPVAREYDTDCRSLKAALKQEERNSKASDTALRLLLGNKSKASRREIERGGWKLVAPVVEGKHSLFRRGKRGKFEYMESPNILSKSNSRLSLHLYIFAYCESAKMALDRGDPLKAIGYAFLAGFHTGRSNAIYLESQANSKKRKGKNYLGPYKKLIQDNPTDTNQEIIAKLPPALYGSAERKTHENRVSAARKKLSLNH